MKKSEASSNAYRFVLYGLLVNIVISISALCWSYFSTSKRHIVYVDSMQLLSEYKGMAAANKEFKLKVESWNANLDTLKLEFQKKLQEYEATEGKLSKKEKGLMEELLESKKQQMINYQQITTEKVKQANQELTSKVYEQVNDYLKRYGKEKGYSIIFAATQYGNIVYAEDATNITEEVLIGLNADFVE